MIVETILTFKCSLRVHRAKSLIIAHVGGTMTALAQKSAISLACSSVEKLPDYVQAKGI